MVAAFAGYSTVVERSHLARKWAADIELGQGGQLQKLSMILNQRITSTNSTVLYLLGLFNL
jgi:hypothetical protein